MEERKEEEDELEENVLLCENRRKGVEKEVAQYDSLYCHHGEALSKKNPKAVSYAGRDTKSYSL